MKINTIPIEKLASLAKFYDTSIDDLVGLTDERKPYPKNKWVFNKPCACFILYFMIDLICIIYQILVIDYYVGMTYNIDINKCLEALLWTICM